MKVIVRRHCATAGHGLAMLAKLGDKLLRKRLSLYTSQSCALQHLGCRYGRSIPYLEEAQAAHPHRRPSTSISWPAKLQPLCENTHGALKHGLSDCAHVSLGCRAATLIERAPCAANDPQSSTPLLCTPTRRAQRKPVNT